MDRGESRSKLSGNVYDMNGSHFNPDMYLQKLFKEYSLKEIMEQEEAVVRDTQTLHSEMQTLVYENYNKFISATDTIRKMKNDFKQMETEMDGLVKNMDSITSFSDQISQTLQDTRVQISKLSGIHSLLKRLQFLFKLPSKLKVLMEEKNFKQAVEDYTHTQKVLNYYAHLESFRGIQNDCIEIMDQIKSKLYLQFESKQATSREVAESVGLLLMLDEPAESLFQEFLSHSAARLDERLTDLENVESVEDFSRIIEEANREFINELCLIVKSFKEMFLSGNFPCETVAASELDEWISLRMTKFFDCIQKRSKIENDTTVLVSALNSLYLSLGPTVSILSYDFTRQVVDIAMECCDTECSRRKAILTEELKKQIQSVRQSLLEGSSQAAALVESLVTDIVDAAEKEIGYLSEFTNPEYALASEAKLRESYAVSVRETLVVGFLHDTADLAKSFVSTCASYPVLLVLAKMCLEFANVRASYLLSLVDKNAISDREKLSKEMMGAAQELGDHYVKMQGNIIGLMLRKAVETRDWAHCSEPKTYRTAMKRVLEELALAEPIVCLFGDAAHVLPPGSGSRHQARSSAGVSWADHGYSHSFHKLFSDKIEIFTPVEFNKSSIFTGIIKISLKTLLECVRLRTFNKFGLQQIQVDIHYFQLHLWRYVSDEHLVQTLLDEILGSAVQRCVEGGDQKDVLMNPGVVDVICERC